MRDRQIKVKWTCERNDPDFEDATEGRCGHEFETVEDFYEWEAKSCYAICPHCKANLTQINDTAIIIDGGRKHNIVEEEIIVENEPNDTPENTGIFKGFGYAKI